MSHRVRAHHRYITDDCRKKGDDKAKSEAMQSTSEVVESLMGSWPAGETAVIHVLVEIEYPEDGDGRDT